MKFSLWGRVSEKCIWGLKSGWWSRKHGYGNLGAVPIPSTAGVRVLHAYPRRTPFFPKKKWGTGRVRIGHRLGTSGEENNQNYIVFPEKIETLPDIFLTVSLPPLSRVGYETLSLDISLSLLSSLCRHSLKSSLYRPRSSTGTKLPALPLLAAPSYHSKLLWVLACFICFNFWLYLILIKFLEIWWRHGRKVRKR